MLMVGCTKDLPSTPSTENAEEVLANFKVYVPNEAVTKAVADNDGNGASVARVKLQVWWTNRGNNLPDVLVYDQANACSTSTILKTSFTNISLIKGQDYNFLFWADNGQVYTTGTTSSDTEAKDGYYTTQDLRAVTIKVAATADAKAGTDARDAFYACVPKTAVSAAFSESVSLYRPFGQLNIITTDLASLYSQLPEKSQYATITPDKVSVTYTAPTEFNVQSGVASKEGNYSYTLPAYSLDNTKAANTLSMDYIFASAEGDVKNIAFSAQNMTTGLTNIDYTFTNIPLKRNWRTNIIGDLLTSPAEFNVEVKPAWTGETDEKVVEVNSVEEFKSALAGTANEVILGADLTLSDARIDISRNMTINLNGHTITPTRSCANGSAFNVKSGNVVIENGNIDATRLTQTAADGYNNECDPITVRSGATATLRDMTISIDNITGACAYSFDGGKITIESGTYSNTATVAEPGGLTAMTVNQANVATQLVFVEGGKFIGCDPAKGDSSKKCTTFLASGYKSVDNGDGSYTVVAE